MDTLTFNLKVSKLSYLVFTTLNILVLAVNIFGKFNFIIKLTLCILQIYGIKINFHNQRKYKLLKLEPNNTCIVIAQDGKALKGEIEGSSHVNFCWVVLHIKGQLKQINLVIFNDALSPFENRVLRYRLNTLH